MFQCRVQGTETRPLSLSVRTILLVSSHNPWPMLFQFTIYLLAPSPFLLLVAYISRGCFTVQVRSPSRCYRFDLLSPLPVTIMQPTSSQWLFPISALQATPTLMAANCSIEKELYDRARGVEFLFRLGSSLQLSVPTSFI